MSAELAPPYRESIPTHQCRCVLKPPGGGVQVSIGPDGRVTVNGRCPNTAVPDSPFCKKCDDRHEGHRSNGWTVGVWVPDAHD